MSTTHTIRLHRVLRTTPEKLFRAFTTADAMCRWLPPFGFLAQVHQLDAKIGGTFKMSFINFTTATRIPSAANTLSSRLTASATPINSMTPIFPARSP